MPEIDIENLLHVIFSVHSQQADDLCWMDIDKIFQAAGLEVPDRRTCNKKAMLENCERFISEMCKNGNWKSYVELEAENQKLKSKIQELEKDVRKLSFKLGQIQNRKF